MRIHLLALLLLVAPSIAFAQASPVGTWTTIDDKSGKPKSIVEIYATPDGTVEGRVVEILQSDRGPNPVCEKCSGERQGKPIKGMVILWGLRRKSEGAKRWEGGKILDPANGKVYSARLRPSEDGRTLEVRGFLGLSMFGRSQTWHRR